MRLLHPSISFDQLYRQLNDPHRFPTPQATIEAVMHSVRERRVAALNDSHNIERLSRCDIAAKAQINRCISALKKSGRIQ
jgi:hypothetical protein